MKKGLLLGAGFSYDLGMPLTSELTEVFLGMFPKMRAERFGEILSQNDPYTKDRPINRKAIFEGIDLLLRYEGANYEELLSNLQELGDTPGKNQSDRDSYHYLFGIFYEIIHQILTIYQIVSYQELYVKNRRWFSSLRNLLSERETWVFTLNHDLYMECLAIDMKIPITYGDRNNLIFPISNLEMNNEIRFTYSKRNELSYRGQGYFKSKFGINLVKVHGGLSELLYKDGSMICNQSLSRSSSEELMIDFIKIGNMAYYHNGKKNPSGKDRVITDPYGELDIICKSMLTGGSKYSSTTNEKEGEEKLKLFDEMLRDIDELTIIGYGFGDRHINYRLSNAMVLNNRLKIRVVDPIDKLYAECLQQFNYDDRLRGALCGAPHWMDYSATQKWNMEQMNSLKENEAIRAIIKDKVNAFFREKNI
jgi:hypothetical protein